MAFEQVLAPSEKERAAQFRFAHLRRSYVVRWGALRCLLGGYLSLEPTSVQFKYGPKGKPGIASAAGIEFNTTHSNGLAAFAFTRDRPIGIDLEWIRPLDGMQRIARRFFCPEEAEEMLGLPPGQQERAFFRCWTRKEAYVKAIGDGLSVLLDEFRVTLLPDQPAQFVHLGHDTGVAEGWTLHNLCLAPRYTAALAYPDKRRPLSVFQTFDPGELLSILPD